ncbi:hypothetical protein CP965_06130 [Halarcobacter mediterraneus]|uniref:NlpC/P60 domain-containing protein n=1 Tax=Halarcobacter mediterraneus TaxID=2023153 RepID=A0A4Q1B532_9BACT|nr:NlpC/P60 family protein [Halarcobacter mediterraneus]RXK13377.1 hypothetical protein CP965_06130 [Halarcobacter mediterraneus]
MKNTKLLFLVIFFILFFTGCFSSSSVVSNPKPNPNLEFRDYEENQRLYDQLITYYYQWKGVKYKYGGNTKRGIDCSAFVQNTFRTALQVKIPRTTKLQSQVGQEIGMADLQIGDLVFFKTGYKSRHVGIYIGGGEFLHASTRKGVTISRLDNPYYSKHLWKIQRILN